MIINLFGYSGNDLKSGKLSSGMGGSFHPESLAGLFRNGWQVWARIYSWRVGPNSIFGKGQFARGYPATHE